MKKKSIIQALGLLGSETAPETEERRRQEPVSAAERLGRALLDTLGLADDVSEDELVEAVLGEWSNLRESETADETAGETADNDSYEPMDEPLYDGTADEPDEEEPDEAGPFAGAARRPVPIRTGSTASSPIDYADMSTEQFRELRKLLKKAASEGRKVRL